MRLLITGGTGFFGRALLRHLESVRHADGRLPFDQITVLSRSPDTFLARYPELANLSWLDWHCGDVLDPNSLPQDGGYQSILHAATDSTDAAALTPIQVHQQIVDGTKNMLQFAATRKTQRFLLTSSGAAYGTQPAGMEAIPEIYQGMPDPLKTANTYGVAKRQAEHLSALYGEQHGFDSVIARCFAFVGQDLPLDVHFAIGNFIRDALWRDEITVAGDGTAVRSYLDQNDLAEWLMCLLDRGQSGRAYNVGSDKAISIADLAHLVRDLVAPEKPVRILGQSTGHAARSRYVPDISRARMELGLTVSISLTEAIKAIVAAIQRVDPSKDLKVAVND